MRLTNFFLHFLFFLIGVLLLYLAFGKLDFAQMWLELQKFDYRWGIPILLITIFNQIVRAARWRLLIEPLQKKVSLSNTFWAVMFGYFVNMAVPRLGEVSRCWALHKTDKVPFVPAVGTVITERAIDVLSLVLVMFLVLLFQFNFLINYFDAYLFKPLWQIWQSRQVFSFILLGFLLLFCTLLWIFRKQILQFSFIQKLLKIAAQLWLGIRTIAQMPKMWLFLWHTFLIWATYFLMTYLWFFALPATSHLGIHAGMALLAMGSISRLAPIQGSSMGAYHYLVIKGLLLFGIPETIGAVLAFVIHTAQLVYTLILGVWAMVVIYWKNIS